MSLHAKVAQVPAASAEENFLGAYLETLSMVERLHRLLLDVIKDEFERLGITDINSVQALLLFNIGDSEVTAGELKTRGYYRARMSRTISRSWSTWATCTTRKRVDRRAVRVRLTEKGRNIRSIIAELFQRHANGILSREVLGGMRLEDINASLRRMERYWSDQIRYIY